MKQCVYCKRWFKNQHGLNIHYHFCKQLKLIKLMHRIMREGNVYIHTITPYPDVENKIRYIKDMI